MDNHESVCIKIFDGPTFEASLQPRMNRNADGQAQPDGTYLLTLHQPAAPGAMQITARISQFMHATLEAHTIEDEPEPVGPTRELRFTLTITGRITGDGIDSRVRDV